MTRAERVAQVFELRAQGLKQREIAAELGISRSHVSALLTDSEGTKDRARKDSYGGRCATCGAPTTGCNGRDAAPLYCKHHAPVEYAYKHTVWTPGVILDAIRLWADTYGEPPTALDWNPYEARARGDKARARRFETDRRWPAAMTAIRAFGNWNAAIAAAGFTPRAARRPRTVAK